MLTVLKVYWTLEILGRNQEEFLNDPEPDDKIMRMLKVKSM